MLSDDHLPLEMAELKAKFPLVDASYKSGLPFDKNSVDEFGMHQRQYEVAKYVANTFYDQTTYDGDVMMVTHAAAVIALVRGILTLREHPEALESAWYAPGGSGRVPVFAGVSCYHKLTQSEASHLHWEHNYSENEASLLDSGRDYNWVYKPDRPRL